MTFVRTRLGANPQSMRTGWLGLIGAGAVVWPSASERLISTGKVGVWAPGDNPAFMPTGRALNPVDVREFIANQTSLLLGERVRVKPLRGGEKSKDRILYKGRTINEYYSRYKALSPGESAEDALVPLVHMRGNHKQRLCPRIRELMTESWETIGLDKKNTSVANVHAYLQTLIAKENLFRRLNELRDFVTPSEKTLRRHRDTLVTPTEYAIATEGKPPVSG